MFFDQCGPDESTGRCPVRQDPEDRLWTADHLDRAFRHVAFAADALYFAGRASPAVVPKGPPRDPKSRRCFFAERRDQILESPSSFLLRTCVKTLIDHIVSPVLVVRGCLTEHVAPEARLASSAETLRPPSCEANWVLCTSPVIGNHRSCRLHSSKASVFGSLKPFFPAFGRLSESDLQPQEVSYPWGHYKTNDTTAFHGGRRPYQFWRATRRKISTYLSPTWRQ